MTNDKLNPPAVRIVGPIDHPDFRDAAELLRATTRSVANANGSPELVIAVQSRPNETSQREIDSLPHRWPLAGVVALLGSWCEGDARTGKPWPGVKRLYWYEFPAWWRQQLALQTGGRCPDWSRPSSDAFRAPPIRNPKSKIRNRAAGALVLSTPYASTADALGDVLSCAGYATVWQRPGRTTTVVRGAVAGIWDGSQLDDRETNELAEFCRRLARDAAPVVALLDFPRRDRHDIAMQVGAAAVFGKPWINKELIETIEYIAQRNASSATTARTRAA
jgi:hypothetical protein